VVASQPHTEMHPECNLVFSGGQVRQVGRERSAGPHSSSPDLEDERAKTVALSTAHTILQSLNSLRLGQAAWDPVQG